MRPSCREGGLLTATLPLVTAADFLVTYLDADLAQATQHKGPQALALMGAHDVDLLADMGWDKDMQLHLFAGGGQS